ncbi:hypothetical protein JCM11251_005443 [Rhodosporidiobolus azoricus]
MQGLLQAVAGPPPLSLANLAAHTKQEGLAPRRTVRLYLDDQRKTAGQYVLPPPPSDEFDALDPASFPAIEVAVPQNEGKRRTPGEADRRADTALVMHVPQDGATDGGAHRSSGLAMSRSRSKPSLVAAMRPRLSSAPNSSSPAALVKCKRQSNLAAEEDTNAAAGPSGSSSILVARAEQKPAVAKAHPPADFMEGVSKAVETKRDRKGKGKENEEEPVKMSKSAIQKKGKLRAEVEHHDEEKAELEDRLRARRERRASKALIRKDRTQTAASVGIAAAEKVKKARKAKKRADRGSGDESDLAAYPSPKKTRKKRTSLERESRTKVQDLERPSGVGASRLTLKPPKQLGIFNKGKASARTQVGQRLPDLAFSELNFLNSTRRSPPSSPTGSSSPSDENPHPQPALLRPTTLPRTYGLKSKTRRTSSKHFPAGARGDYENGVEELPSPRPNKKRKPSTERKKASAEQDQRKRPRASFPYIEIPPIRRSSSSASLSRQLPRSPTKATLKARPETGTTTTNDSVLSAASLARRRRSAPDPAARRRLVDVNDLPEPLLRRREEQQEVRNPSFGGGFDAQLGEVEQHDESSLPSSFLQRLIDDAGVDTAVDQVDPEAGQSHRPRGAFFTPHGATVHDLPLHHVPPASAGDGFIHLRPVSTFPSGGHESIPPFIDVPSQPAAVANKVYARPDTPSQQYGAEPLLGETTVNDDIPSALPFAAPAPATFSDTPSGLPSLSACPSDASTIEAPSALAPLAKREEEHPRPAFLRSAVPQVLGDLEDEGTWREAMRKQWPKTRC